MEINGIIERKLDLLNDHFYKIQKMVPTSFEELCSNFERQKALERMLQIMVEIMIDVADRLISISDRSPAATSSESFLKLQELEFIKDSSKYKFMVQFRNFIVHRYESVDLEIIYGILKRHLTDFSEFENEIRKNIK